MAEASGVVHECVKAGEAIVVPCPNDQSPSLVMEWRTVGSGTLIGHWLTCPQCRPEGAWSCAVCACLVDPDATAIRAHVGDCYG